MVRLPDLTAWAITIFADIFVVYLFLVQWRFRKFLFLNFFFLFSAVIKVILYASFLHFGLASIWYSYFYFIGGALLRVLFFLSICELIAHLVKARILRVTLTILRGKPMQWISGAFVAAVLLRVSVPAFWDSYTLIGLLSKFSQNMLYVCCSAIVLLWVWKLPNDFEDRIAAHFVNALGVYSLLSLFIHGIGQLTPHVADLTSLYLMIGAWLPLGCGFAIVSHQQPNSTRY